MTLIERPSVCTFDCADTCSLTVTVDAGRIAKVRGSTSLPYTDGVICNKVARDMGAYVHGPDRLMQPLLRAGPKGSGAFTPITWDEALARIRDAVGDVIAQHGPQAVLPLNYAGPHGLLSMDSMSSRFFNKLGATQLYRRALCGGVRAEAWAGTFGAAPGIPPEMAEEASLNVVWGNNATVAYLHLVRRIRRSMRNGGKLIAIDPKRTKIAEQADLHLAILPGTDVLLGWALASELERIGAFDQAFIADNVLGFEPYMAQAREWTVERAAQACAIAAEDIRTAARWMAEADPFVLTPGVGLERSRNGGSGIRTALALPALMGKLGWSRPGRRGGIVGGAGNSFPKTPAKLQRPDLIPPGTRTLNILDIGRHLVADDLDPPLKALFIYNHNPIVVHPDQNRMRKGLAREDIFMVGIDIAMTESMSHCDVVLPAATHFECEDIYAAYGHHWLQRAEAVIAPLGEAMPNTEIFRRLAASFGFDDACFKATDAELIDEAIDPADARMGGVLPSRISPTKPIAMKAGDGNTFVMFENTRPATPSGKVELLSETLAKKWGKSALLPTFRAIESAFPLSLITPASDRRISSTLGGLHAREPLSLEMNPVDAAARGLSSGQTVRVFNDLGEVMLVVDVSDAVPPGVVASEKGAWLSSSATGQTVSALVSADARADLGEGACFNDARIEVAATLHQKTAGGRA